MLLTRPLTQRCDQMRDIAHGDDEREIDRLQHLSEEDPPSRHDGQEAERPRRDLQFLGHDLVAGRELPVRAGEDDEGEEEAHEDGDEDEVGA